MRLGLFFTGISPSGFSSEFWTITLDGNVGLSATIRATSTLVAFGTMPLSIFTMGRTIFSALNLNVPHFHVIAHAVALVIPLTIGFLLRKFAPGFALSISSILKRFVTPLCLFIVAFTVITNRHFLEQYTWQVRKLNRSWNPQLTYLLN